MLDPTTLAPEAPSLPPGPSTHPYLQALQYSRDPAAFFEDCWRKFGDTFTIRLANQPPNVVFAAPKDVRAILAASPDDLRGGEATEPIDFLVGRHGIVRLDGARHARERKLIMPSFHGERMLAYGERMRDTATRYVEAWRPGVPFSAVEFGREAALDVIVDCIFGIPAAEQERFKRVLLTFLDRSMTPAAMIAWTTVPGEALREFLSDRLGPMTDRLPDRLARGLPGVALARALRELDAMLHADIRRRRAAAGGERDDVMSMLLDARDEHGHGLADAQLRDEMMALLLGGHETTANSLAWALLMLCEHPQVAARVRAELHEAFGSGPLELAEIRSLPYLDAVVKETLRLYPITAMLGRKLVRPTRIGAQLLPAGVVAAPAVYLVHRHPEVWSHADKFMPERFLARRPKPHEYIPFGGGLRTCVGMSFGLFELKIMLATVLRMAELRRASKQPARLIARAFLLGASNPIPLVMLRRLTSGG